MNSEFREEKQSGEHGKADAASKQKKIRRNPLAEWTASLLSLGLGEGLLRLGTALLSLTLIGAAIWLLSAFNESSPLKLGALPAFAAGPTATPFIDPNLLPPPTDSLVPGVSRLAEPHTNVPTRPRQEVVTYTVQEGDSVFGIAEKYNLLPQTILWANFCFNI